MTIIDAIIEFSREQPDWIQDGLRRLAIQGDLSTTDKKDLLALLQAENDISTEGELPIPSPLSREHFRPTDATSSGVTLLEIRDVKRANRLASGQSLRFGSKGITLIYGDNGSGKSGYCRLLKRLCRVREGAEELVLPNVFEQSPRKPAEAVARFLDEEGMERVVTWLDGTPPPSSLRRLSVFDSRAAPLYVDRDGKVEYLPGGFDLLPRLGQLLQDLENEVTVKQREIETRCASPLPQIPSDTAASSLLARLTGSGAADILPTLAEISEIAQFSETDAKRLAELEGALSENAAATARLLESAAGAAKELAHEITALLPELNDSSIQITREEVRLAREARTTADLAANSTFTAEPLAGVGSGPWRRMFEYARAYSELAYPGVEFPVVGNNTHCLLCQQELGAVASERLQRFDAYVRGSAEAEAKERAATVEHRASRIGALEVSDPTKGTLALGGLDGAYKPLQISTQAMLTALRDRSDAMINFTTGKVDVLTPTPLPNDPSPTLTEAATALAKRSAEVASAQNDPDARQRLENERNELEARTRLADNRQIVEARRADLEMLHKLRACYSACDTTRFSTKNTQLRREFLTEAFRERLKDEIHRLDIEYLPIKVSDRTGKLESYIGVALDAVARVKPQDVLSEGERKALALAAFFAEVEGQPLGTGLIFDDPVSSLDHCRRKKVADRIVAAGGAGRQAIVFTHDLAFYNEVKFAAAAASPPVAVITHEVRRTEEHGFGTVEEDSEPWFVAKVGPRLTGLEKKLSILRSATVIGGEEHRQAVVAFYADLRDTWERLVEAELLNGVVSRFCKDVKTQSLREVSVEDEDYRRIFFAMKKASDWCHSSPPAGQVVLPDAKDAAKDLNDLTTFSRGIKERKKRLNKARKDLEDPPKATLS